MTHTSREYAEALFELALEAEETAAFSAGLDLVEEGLKENPGFLALLSSPAISREERMDALSAAFQERIPLAEMILRRMMVSRGHARNLLEMITSYRELEREHRGESVARVITAVPLTKEEAEKLQNRLEARFHRKMDMVCTVDPALIGGIRVETEGRVLDGSLKARLQEIKEVMNT